MTTKVQSLEDELIAKIKSGEAIHEIRRWFVQAIVDAKLQWKDLTPFMQAFTNQIVYAFEAWRRETIEQEEKARH